MDKTRLDEIAARVAINENAEKCPNIAVWDEAIDDMKKLIAAVNTFGAAAGQSSMQVDDLRALLKVYLRYGSMPDIAPIVTGLTMNQLVLKTVLWAEMMDDMHTEGNA